MMGQLFSCEIRIQARSLACGYIFFGKLEAFYLYILKALSSLVGWELMSAPAAFCCPKAAVAMNALVGSAEGWGQILRVKPELAQTSVDQAIGSPEVLLCRHWWRVLSTPVPQGAAGNAQEMLQFFQHYPSCEQHIC